jgi:DNA-directed RNA polymerase specialized sigma24 family protein
MDGPDRLSQIDTLWSVVRRAHDGAATGAQDAQRQLLFQYGNAIQRYLRTRLRDPSVADDVYQDFAVKFVRGDFHNATPEKGRFRTFIRTVLYRQVADFHRNRKRDVQLDEKRMEPVAPPDDDSGDDQFAEVWRDEMLKNAWAGLYALQKESGKPWYTVLQLRVNNPEMRSVQLARALADELDKPISSANVRVLLHRSRERFSGLLIEAIADSLDSKSYDEIEDELAELRLLEYCHASLEHMKQQAAANDGP